MALQGLVCGSVLIIDPSEPIRELVTALLQRSGFRTTAVADAGEAPRGIEFDVIVRDLNLAPDHRQRALDELDRTDSELLQRTVIITTAPARLSERAQARTFAVLRKPFDIEELLDAVRLCCEQRTAAVAEDAAATVDFTRLRRFVRDIPRFHEAMTALPSTPNELLLRSELRRVALELSSTLDEAALLETDRTRAAVLSGASAAAAELAAAPAALRPARHDH